MTLSISSHLFTKPRDELEEGPEVTEEGLRDLGTALNERLQQAADLVGKLTGDGWYITIGLYDLQLKHEAVRTRAAAERRLQSLGLDPDDFEIEELEDEDEVV